MAIALQIPELIAGTPHSRDTANGRLQCPGTMRTDRDTGATAWGAKSNANRARERGIAK
jgi:hypothetical protein